ncbi:MAG TPA: hypothetical protein VFB20_15620 [Burkholderiales bacterium]|nr:hypothetical protein [Burkholderiales bacterium]
MTAQIQDIMDALVTMQQAIAIPGGGLHDLQAFDEPPASVAAFPVFVNIETGIQNVQLSGSHRHIEHLIDMHLLFAPTDQKYSVRERRLWVQAVLDAFGGKIRLGLSGAVGRIESVTYDPFALNDVEYIAATFSLRVLVDDAFAAAS